MPDMARRGRSGTSGQYGSSRPGLILAGMSSFSLIGRQSLEGLEGADAAPLVGEHFSAVVVAARTGSVWAWTALYRSAAAPVLAYLCSNGCSEPEQELERAMVTVAQQLHTFKGDEPAFRQLVASAAYNRLTAAGFVPALPIRLFTPAAMAHITAVDEAVEHRHVGIAAAAAEVVRPPRERRGRAGRVISLSSMSTIVAGLPMAAAAAAVVAAAAVGGAALAQEPPVADAMPQSAVTAPDSGAAQAQETQALRPVRQVPAAANLTPPPPGESAADAGKDHRSERAEQALEHAAQARAAGLAVAEQARATAADRAAPGMARAAAAAARGLQHGQSAPPNPPDPPAPDQAGNGRADAAPRGGPPGR